MNAAKYPTPLDPAVARWADELNDADLEWFNERAGIFEFDAGLSRAEAEQRAREATVLMQLRRNAAI